MVSGQSSVNSYQYDAANRLVNVSTGSTTAVNGVDYSWDNNGNLLGDGANVYTYDYANRLTEVSNSTGTNTYQYNGLGDRLTQNGVQYTLDLNTGLTQVLSDGTTSYTYGLGRISQQNGTTPEYFLGDALGSVRQLTDQAGEITLAQSYDPYGKVAFSSGASHVEFGFTGEQYSVETQLLYLRARFYNPNTGRFSSRDTWAGTDSIPATLNRFAYAHNNPVTNTDPSGNCIFAGVDTYICAILTGGFVGGVTGAVVGGVYAGWMYHLAYTGKCGCEGQQLINQYTQAQFVKKGLLTGLAFGAVFGALAGAGFGGGALAALAGVGLSTIGIADSIYRIQSNPNNECAWLDLGFSIFGLAASLGTLVSPRVFYNKAVQNPEAESTLIGRYIENSPLSYDHQANSLGLRHLSLKSVYYEMFKGIFGERLWWKLINEPFIVATAKEGKPVFLSTNPIKINSLGADSILAQEYNLLLRLGYRKPIPVDSAFDFWIMTKP